MIHAEITAAIDDVLALSPPHVAWDKTTEKQRAENKQQQKIFDLACENLCEQLRQANTDNVFDVMFPLACTHRGGDFYAHILLYMKAPCPLSCTEAIRRISRSDWDVSLEEVPWYVAACFGTDAIYQSLDELEAEDDIQEFRKVEAAWHTLNSGPMSLSKYLEMEEKKPRHSVEVRLDVIRYWTDILVRDEGGRLENWHPFWWRSKDSTD